MASNDLVVVLPGIMGSTLRHKGKLVWAPSGGSALRAIATFGRSIKALQLPDGIGDNNPEDGVEAVDLMPDLHVLPGIWAPVKGYTPLLDRLRSIGFTEASGNLLVMPYDWRLSNRLNAVRIKAKVERALERWRAKDSRNRDARLVFVCHSMGGLIARWYIEKCGGAELTRKLITLGTPYRGAPQALGQLVNGVSKGIGPFSVDLTEFARSLPSLHQLLPSYACVDHQANLATLIQVSPAVLETGRVRDSALFYSDLEAAEQARPASSSIRHAILGVRQTTASTVNISNDRIEIIDTYQDENLFGDGTVPVVAGPDGVPLDDNTLRRIADKHGNLQRNKAALDEVESIITSSSIVIKAAGPIQPRVDAPELIMAGQPILVQVTIEDDPRLAVTITVQGESGQSEVQTPRPSAGISTATFTNLVPGAYQVTVEGRAPGSPVAPVSSIVLVWPPEGIESYG
jgi:pimeloyl-ACP methyl ester carboxylesterase